MQFNEVLLIVEKKKKQSHNPITNITDKNKHEEESEEDIGQLIKDLQSNKDPDMGGKNPL